VGSLCDIEENTIYEVKENFELKVLAPGEAEVEEEFT
jgi:hypothetical protein